jgi:DNA-binding MarR family transcriptional regulator
MDISRAHAAAVIARLAQRGYIDFPFASASLLWLLNKGGTRSTVLAQRARITKQAMSQQVRVMESQGYLERVPDPSDTRAKLVRMTPRGEAVKAACEEVRAELNQRAAKLVGKEKAREMEAHLDAMTRIFTDIASSNGMEEVIGSILIRSTK